MQINLTEIVVALIGLLGTICTAVVVPYIKGKIGDAKWEELRKKISTGVSAAEQLSNTGVISKAARKQHVIDAVNNSGILQSMKRWGITVDIEEIYDMIEAAVYDLPSKITTNEVKKIAEQKVEAMAEATVEKKAEQQVTAKVEEKLDQKVEAVVSSKVEEAVQTKVEEVVQTKVEEKVDTTIKDAVESAVGDKLGEVVEQKVQEVVNTPEPESTTPQPQDPPEIPTAEVLPKPDNSSMEQ